MTKITQSDRDAAKEYYEGCFAQSLAGRLTNRLLVETFARHREQAVETQAAEIARLREALSAYTEYCHICHGRGTIIEADDATGAILWNDCPGCTPARAALEAKP